jgi:hypothetical protein
MPGGNRTGLGLFMRPLLCVSVASVFAPTRTPGQVSRQNQGLSALDMALRCWEAIEVELESLCVCGLHGPAEDDPLGGFASCISKKEICLLS